MTFAFGAFTLGYAILVSAFTDATFIDVVMGRKGKSIDAQSHTSFLDSAGTTVSSGLDAVSGTIDTSATGLATWKNGGGDTVQIAKWIYNELVRVHAQGKIHISSGYRTYSDQVAACANTSGPCATPGTSNHEKKTFPGGAIDVDSGAAWLDQALRKAHSPLKYAGAKDPVHFSHPHDGSY